MRVTILCVTGTLALAPASAMAGGDGWNVFFDSRGHVFNIFHHNNAGNNPAIDCHTRNGLSCGANWPYYFNASAPRSDPLFWNTTNAVNGWVDNVNKRIWFPSHTLSKTGFACVDVSDITQPAPCFGDKASAFKALGDEPVPKAANMATITDPDGVTVMAAVGSKLFTFESATGKLLCLDAAASPAPCANQPYNLVTGAGKMHAGMSATWPFVWAGQILASGGRIWGHVGTQPATPGSIPGATYAVCFDPATNAPCPGFPKALNAFSSPVANNMYPLPSPDGTLRGVCYTNTTTTGSAASACFTQAGTPFADDSGLSAVLTMPDNGPGLSSLPLSTGSRVYWVDGVFKGSGGVTAGQPMRLLCYDVATRAYCPGWPIDRSVLAGSSYYYTDWTYAISIDDRGCIWKNGDNTLVGAFTPDGRPQGWFLGSASAQIDSNICTAPAWCDLNAASTLSQGGWSARRSNSPLNRSFFSGKFPAGLMIGGSQASVLLTSETAVQRVLPNSGVPARLRSGVTQDPTSVTLKNTLAGQAIAATLNIAFNAPAGMGAARVQWGPYLGMTAEDLLAAANSALNGDSLPGSSGLSSLAAALDALNRSFEAGARSGYLACPAP